MDNRTALIAIVNKLLTIDVGYKFQVVRKDYLGIRVWWDDEPTWLPPNDDFFTIKTHYLNEYIRVEFIDGTVLRYVDETQFNIEEVLRTYWKVRKSK